MRNKLFKAIFVFSAVLSIGGCNKEGGILPQSGDASFSHDPLEQLRTFKKQITAVKANPEKKSDETITLDEALWDVENYFNLTYSDPESYYSTINEHIFTLTLPINEQQQVLISDAVNLYGQAVNNAREAFLSDEFEDKGFISLAVKEVNTGNRGTVITFSGKIGNRTNYNPPVPHINGPFQADDNWMFAAPLGKCDDPDIPSGADEQLQERLYAELIDPFIETSNGFRNIYVDRLRFIFDGTTYNGVYYNTNSDDLCIDYGYMNDYLHAEKRLLTQTLPSQYQLVNYSPVSIEISGIMLGNGAVTHRNEIEYGIRMEVSLEEFGDIENLLIQQ